MVGKKLVRISSIQDGLQHDNALQSWRQDLWNCLRNNPRKLLSHQEQALATAVPDTFPDMSVVDLYTCPLISAVA